MKRRNVLLKSYKMGKGGFTKPFSSETTSAITGGGMVATGLIDAIDPADRFGTRTGVGAAGAGAVKGATALAGLGPAGLVVGGVLGAATGFLGNKKAQEAKQNVLTEEVEDATKARDAEVLNRLANNPELQYGSGDAQMYNYGGTVKGKPSGRFNLMRRTPKSVNLSPDLLPTVAISPSKMVRFKNGGRLKPLAEGISKVEGSSHEDGGVQFPELNAELEGGETISGDFVFSKDLGFAKIHERLAKSMNKNSKRPLTTLNKQTAEAMVRKEGFLKIYQEQAKKDKGLPNEIDNTAAAMKAEQSTESAMLKYGGKLPSKAKGGYLQDKPKKGISQVQAYNEGTKLYNDYVAKGGKGKTIYNFVNVQRDPDKNGLGGSGLGEPYFMPFVATQDKKSTPVIVPKPAPVAGKPIIGGGPRIGLPKTKATAKAPTAKTPVKTPTVADVTRTLERPANIGNISARTEPPVEPKVKFPTIEKFVKKAPDDTVTETEKPNIKIGDIANSIAPFASNIANAFRKLPAPPKPIMDDTLTPNLINLDASRAEATRQRRGADKVAAASLNGNNQVAAVKAANLTQDIRAKNDINQAEQTTNTGIKNQFSQINAGITRNNTLKKDMYNTQTVERQVKQQELNAENLADVGNKIQLANRDKAQFALEDTKNLLTILGDPTGATIRASGDTLKRIIKDPKIYADVLKHGKDLEKMNAEDRALAVETMKAQLNLIKPSSVLNTNVALPADNKVTTQALKDDYLKARTAAQINKKK